MTIRVGISGWTYAPWRGDFYPEGLPQRRELEYAASKLTSIEINGSFYSLQRPSSWEKWRAEVPDDFVFAVKGGRFITHMKRLQDVEQPLANFFAQGVLGLGDKLGPVLWQLPADLPYDGGVLAGLLSTCCRARRARPPGSPPGTTTGSPATGSGPARWPTARSRTPSSRGSTSFAAEEARAHLDEADVALVVADSAGKWPRFEQASRPVRLRPAAR